MYYMVLDCPFIPTSKKFENMEKLKTEFRGVLNLSSIVSDAFDEYLNEEERPVRMFGEEYRPSWVLYNVDLPRYRRMKEQWFGRKLNLMDSHFILNDPIGETDYDFFGWTVCSYKGDAGLVRVFCKDTRKDVDSVYLHSIYDSVEEAEDSARTLNAISIHNMRNNRYFVADKDFKPTDEQVMARLRQVTVTPTR